MRVLILRMIILILVPGPALAQRPEHAWENLNQLREGCKIKVVDMNLKSWKGSLVSVSDEAITIRELRKQQEITVERANVFRVTDVRRSRRGRSALIGLAAGAIVGAAWPSTPITKCLR